ncbi:MAG TPA: efflux RND transporter periplasmic adaptor subunit [Povalibacter sp.]|nr:efflux RND transporter periplasmic adaptor subunit [Povalibacter sp.]
MKPAIRYSIWTLVTIFVLTGIAAPKVLPLLHASETTSGTEKGGKEKGGAGRAPLRVSAVVVQPAVFAETLNSTGTLLAEESVELQAETNGKVVAIHFTEGARVRKGELLVKLNDADLAATRERARYRKQLATLRERRIAQLLRQGVARLEEYDTALNELNVQDAEIALTEAQIAKTEIRAPFDGVVGLRYVSEGSFVNAATRIATLQRLDRLKVDFSIPEKYATRLRVGSPIAFAIAGGDRRFQGQIYAFDPRIDTTTRTVLIRALCPNPEGRLLPGAFANVEVTLSQLSDALLVPAVAVVPGLNEKNVFVVKDGKAEQRPVQTGTRTQSTVHVLSGLAPGDVVITSGLQQVRAGQAVTVIGETSS